MALRFMEGFDYYASGVIGTNSSSGHMWWQRWTGISHYGGGTGCQGSLVTGRYGQGFQGSANNCEFRAYKDLDAQATWIIGWAWKAAGLSSMPDILLIQDSGFADQISVYVSSSGEFNIYRGNGSVYLTGSSGLGLSPNVWYYFELKVTIDNSAGAVEGRVNGVTVCSASSIDTQQTANADGYRINFGGDRTQTGTTVIDDIYICDGTGSAPYNDFLGDIAVEALYPNGNGTTSNFTGSDGNSTDNYLLVDEHPDDNDTTYVTDSTVNNKDTYAYTDLSASSGTVYAVNPLMVARKIDSGSVSLKSVARLSGGTEEDSAGESLGNSYDPVEDIRTTKPGGGSWSISDVNGAEFGAKVA